MNEVDPGHYAFLRLIRTLTEEWLVTEGGSEIDAEKSAYDCAEALGWRNPDGTPKSAVDYEAEKAIDVTPTYVRVRVRRVGDFTPGSFRTIDLSKARGIRAVIGRLKGKTTTARQSILFRRDKGWTPSKAEKWVRDNGMKPV